MTEKTKLSYDRFTPLALHGGVMSATAELGPLTVHLEVGASGHCRYFIRDDKHTYLKVEGRVPGVSDWQGLVDHLNRGMLYDALVYAMKNYRVSMEVNRIAIRALTAVMGTQAPNLVQVFSSRMYVHRGALKRVKAKKDALENALHANKISLGRDADVAPEYPYPNSQWPPT